MPDYSKGKIYRIVIDTNEEYLPYIGSTTQTLSTRMARHRADYKRWKDGKSRKVSSFDLFEIFGIENCEIILIEEYSCDSVEQLNARERYWFDNINNCNKCKPIRTNEEMANYGKISYQKLLETNPNFVKERYQRDLELHPYFNKEHYQKRLERNPNYNKEHYQKRLERNPNYSKEYRQKKLERKLKEER